MFRIVEYRPDHFRALSLQPAQAQLRLLVDANYAEMLAETPAYTALYGDTPLICAGIQPQWDGRASAWAVLGENAGAYMVQITRGVRDFLDRQDYRRIDTCVRDGFLEGNRWAKLLGFRCEGLMRKWMYGDDFWMFSRVRD